MRTQAILLVLVVLGVQWLVAEVSPLVAPEHLSPFTLAVSALTGCFLLHEHLLWRVTPYRLVLGLRPNLGGKWKGTVERKNPDAGAPQKTDVTATIKQTASTIHFRLEGFGDDGALMSDSHTLVAAVEPLANGDHQLIGVYRVTKNSAPLRTHLGGMHLDLRVDGKGRHLQGHFWSQSGKLGEMKLTQAKE